MTVNKLAHFLCLRRSIIVLGQLTNPFKHQINTMCRTRSSIQVFSFLHQQFSSGLVVWSIICDNLDKQLLSHCLYNIIKQPKHQLCIFKTAFDASIDFKKTVISGQFKKFNIHFPLKYPSNHQKVSKLPCLPMSISHH